MENKAHALAAGAFVLAIAALLAALTLWLMRDVTNTVAYEMTSTDAVTGLQVQAPVRYKGVAVGKVTSIDFDPAQRGNVLVTVAVRPDAPVTASTFATLAFQGVTGLSFVQLDDDGQSAQAPQPGPNGIARIPLRPNLFGQLSDQASEVIKKADQAMDGINQLLGPANQQGLTQALAEIRATSQSFNQLATQARQILEAQLGPRHSSIPQLVQQTTATFKTLEGVGTKADRVLDSIHAVTDELQRSTAALLGPDGWAARLEESANTVTTTTLPRIQTLTEDASRTIRRLDRIAGTLGENPQALLYGSGPITPGPGEPGFVAPSRPEATLPR